MTDHDHGNDIPDIRSNNKDNNESETRVLSGNKNEKRITSWIWKYFEIISDEKAKCTFCK